MVYSRFMIVLLTCTLLAGCAHRHFDDTPACMNYHSMMTAPMPAQAMQRLQKQCEASLQAQRSR